MRLSLLRTFLLLSSLSAAGFASGARADSIFTCGSYQLSVLINNAGPARYMLFKNGNPLSLTNVDVYTSNNRMVRDFTTADWDVIRINGGCSDENILLSIFRGGVEQGWQPCICTSDFELF